ncbi:MAG TPA: hypothetical protein VGQ69_12730 [Gemmatimonadales bacterium]|jgi:hypothetical protein|nr:hypothetical protein [Gemmatimonadales bacterium]
MDRHFMLLQIVGVGQALFGIATLFLLLGTGVGPLTLGAATITLVLTGISLGFLQGSRKSGS